METHLKQMMAARTALVLDQPFFGVLALRLKLKADPSCQTAWVDGRTLGYSPAFIDKLTHAERVALVAHEVMHCACGHPWRRDARDHKRWNVACDYAINPVLRDAHFTLPEGALLDPANDGKSAEWIYARLPKPQPDEEPEQGDDESQDGEGGSGSGDGQDDEGDGEGDSEDQGQDEPSSQGEVRDAPADAAQDGATEADWKGAVQQAANAAAAQGKLPSTLERFASAAAQEKVNWRSALRRFVQQAAQSDYTWMRPSPRYVARGLYMPKLHSEELGPVVVAIDTSGSIDEVLLGQFNAEVQAIVDETKPASVHVIYCDAQVQSIEVFERGEPVTLNPKGGGGTRFAPVFDAVAEMEEPPVCLIYLTDLYGGFPSYVPDVPTLWATTCVREVPFGEVLPIDA